MKLGTKQLIVLRWLMDGRSDVEIAAIEDLPHAQVAKQVKSVFKSLNVETLDGAVSVAQRYQLF